MKNFRNVGLSFGVTLIIGGFVASGLFLSGHQASLVIVHKSEPVPAPELFAGLRKDATEAQLAERIHESPNDLSDAQQVALEDWIESLPAAKMPREEKLYLSNEVMDLLCTQKHAVADLTGELIRLAKDNGNDPGTRAYAIQHVVERIEPLGKDISPEPDGRVAVGAIQSVLKIADEPHDEVAGTALLILHLMVQASVERAQESGVVDECLRQLQNGPLKQAAVVMVVATDDCDGNRITALQVCAVRHYEEALPIARTLVNDESRGLTLRLSSIAAIGALGDKSDIKLLNITVQRANPRLGIALSKALKKIEVRTAVQLGHSEAKAVGFSQKVMTQMTKNLDVT